MLRRCCVASGAFITNQTLVADWKQYLAREDNHNGAKNLLASVQQGALQELHASTALRMLSTFVAHHNMDSVTKLIKYMRESMQMPLRPLHYNSLLRVATFVRDKENILQLLGVMGERNAYDGDSIGCAITALHTFGGKDALPSMLKIVSLAHKHEFCLAEEPDPLLVSEVNAVAGGQRPRKSSPILTSLMHHVCSRAYGPIAALLVAFWIRAVGADFASWDYANLLACLLRDVAQFSSVRSAFSFVESAPPGCISFSQLTERLAGGKQPTIIRDLLKGIGESLQRATFSSESPVNIGFINRRFGTVEQLIELIFDEVHAGNSVGALQESPFQLHHFRILLHSQLKDNAAAILSFVELARRYEHWLRQPSNQKLEFDMTCYVLWDVGALFPLACDATRVAATGSYSKLLDAIRDKATQQQRSFCGAYCIPLIRSSSEASLAFSQIVATMKGVSRPSRLQRQLFKSFTALCALNPPRNPKLTAKGASERAKWFAYYEARDMTLTLFGGNHAFAKIEQLFQAKNALPGLRSDEAVKKDCEAVCDLFQITPNVRRMTASHLQFPLYTVPFRMVSPVLVNQFPRAKMLLPVGSEPMEHDHFPRLWEYLTTCGDDWYLRDSELVMLLLRCLLHRLDWENAVSLVQSALKRITFAYQMDEELCHIFEEIGDPAGAVCFKMASKITDSHRAAAEAKKTEAHSSAS